MKKTLKQLALLPLFCGLVATVACNKDDDKEAESGAFDGKIEATVVNGSQLNGVIGTVQLVYFDGKENNFHTLASGTWSNGGFSLNLPETIHSRYLINIEGVFGGEISDTRTNVAIIRYRRESDFYIVGFKSNGGAVVFHRVDRSINSSMWAMHMYVDRDVTITGSNYDNISLKKGWNIMYTNPNAGGKITTKDPGGLRWFFESW